MATMRTLTQLLLKQQARSSTSPMALRRSGASLQRLSSSSSSSDPSAYNAAAAARTLKLLERRKVTTLDIGILKRKKKPITMVTAYDYPSAVHVDLAGFDMLLVGDSLGMVELVRACMCSLVIGTVG